MEHAQKRPSYLAAEGYLLLEERAATKYEYPGGVICDWQGGALKAIAMAAGSKGHNRVSANIDLAFGQRRKNAPREAFIADLHVSAADESACFDPDVVVTCSAADKASEPSVAETLLAAEVLSLWTELFDRGDKFRPHRRFDRLEANGLGLLAADVFQRP